MTFKKLNKSIYYLFAFLGALLFIGLYMQGLGDDEPFTINLIKHSYSQVIHLDLFDVHPPLYYLLLKSFLNLTTFWTKSVIIKIAFARILSFAFFFVSFYFLLLILKILKLRINKIILLIFFFAFPQIASYSLSIRMYQLAAMLVVLEIYGLLSFEHNKSWGLILSIIVLAISFYVNYFTAMFAGAILLVELFSYLRKKLYKKALCILYSGIIDLILFIPGYFFLYHQLAYVSSNNYSNYVDIPFIGRNIYSQILGIFSGKSVGNLSSIIICVIVICTELISMFMVYKYNRYISNLICKLYISIIIGLIPAIILSFIKHPMIVGRYGYPVFFTLYFLVMASILDILNYLNKSLCIKIFVIIVCLLLFVMDIKSTKSLVYNDKVNYNYIRIFQKFSGSDSKIIHLNGSSAIYCSTYLNNKHKEIISKSLPIKSILASNNKKLMFSVFNNISYKN